ncbi:MAG: ribonuclease H family protein [Clostridia bacterium]|nr:ribonuclease H family protein [Clostridia bacterium]
MAKNKPKFYAVKDDAGGTIYLTWDECEAAVKGKNIKYKSFPTREQAQAYLEDVDYIYEKDIKPLLEMGWAVAYTDGSYDGEARVYGYGVCIFTKDEPKPVELSGIGQKEEYLSSRNIAGEIQGVINALRWAENHGYKKILIYHDYEGVGKWAEGVWHAKEKLGMGYIDFIKAEREKLDIRFVWVKGHDANTYNEKVDKLARAAIAKHNRQTGFDDSDIVRIQGAKDEDVVAALALLIKDYPTIKYDVEGEKGQEHYSVTFGENTLSVTLDAIGITIDGDKEELLHMLFVSYVNQALGRRRAVTRDEKKKFKK